MRRRRFRTAESPSLVHEEDSHEHYRCRGAKAHGETNLIAAEHAFNIKRWGCSGPADDGA